MIKKILLAMLLIASVSLAGICMAAGNEFDELDKEHWALVEQYEALASQDKVSRQEYEALNEKTSKVLTAIFNIPNLTGEQETGTMAASRIIEKCIDTIEEKLVDDATASHRSGDQN